MPSSDIVPVIVDIGIPEFVREKTKGRPHVFVLMPFGARKQFYRRMKEKIEQEVGLACLRADDVPAAGHDLLGKVHLLIERAEIIIADITNANPNVFYEVGYSRALKKPMVLLVEAGQDVPTDVRGLEVIRHEIGDDEGALSELAEQVKLRLTSRLALLRDMLQGDKPTPAYVVAAPKHRPSSVGCAIRHTFGDNLGILGLISAFGSLLGENSAVELLSADHFPESFLDEEANVYLIGSKQVNAASGLMLTKLQRGRGPDWYIGPENPLSEVGRYDEALWGTFVGSRIRFAPEKRQMANETICVRDRGIVVRGPHPAHPDRVAIVLAGPTTLGTGAACLAATRSVLLGAIQGKLGTVRIGDKAKSIWVLVEGEVESTSGALQVEGVKVLDAGTYE
jgi:hypothetical protein